MKCLTPAQVEEWWTSIYQFSKLPANWQNWPADHVTRVVINPDLLPAGHVRALASVCTHWLFEPAPEAVLLWVNCFEIWDLEDWNLYYRFRESFGDRSLLADSPGHLLLRHERESVTTLLSLALLFGWDVTVGIRTGRRAIRFDHDGHFSVWDEQAPAREQLTAAIRPFDQPRTHG